jgi:hypothetical protein
MFTLKPQKVYISLRFGKYGALFEAFLGVYYFCVISFIFFLNVSFFCLISKFPLLLAMASPFLVKVVATNVR